MASLSDYQNRLTEGVARYGDRTDFLAIRLETSQSTQIVLESRRVDTLSEAISLGGQVRAYYRGGWGFASFNQLEQLEAQIEQAIAAAKQVGGFTQTGLAPIAPIQDTVILPLPQGDPREISLREKKDLCDRYADLLHQADPHIVSTTIRYSDSNQRTLLATSEGTLIDQTWTDLEMRFAATVRQGDRVQTGRETSGSRQGYRDLLQLDGAVIAAGKRAAQALTLPPVQGDRYTVVIDPILTGLFVHEAFGHLSEADMAYENPDLLAVMEFGKRFGPEDLHIFDGAAPPGHRGSYCYDDEGTPATTTPLIQSGCLVGRLHSRETASHLGETPTGNARCLNYHYPPLVRMTNTWIERGQTPVASLCDGIKLGVYAANWLGGMTNGEMFTFTAGEAWMIRNGQRAEPVRDVTLSGNVFKTLASIEAIGDDFQWDESGGCGKGGQNGLAVGCGGPSLRIRDVVVGGDCAD